MAAIDFLRRLRDSVNQPTADGQLGPVGVAPRVPQRGMFQANAIRAAMPVPAMNPAEVKPEATSVPTAPLRGIIAGVAPSNPYSGIEAPTNPVTPSKTNIIPPVAVEARAADAPVSEPVRPGVSVGFGQASARDFSGVRPADATPSRATPTYTRMAAAQKRINDRSAGVVPETPQPATAAGAAKGSAYAGPMRESTMAREAAGETAIPAGPTIMEASGPGIPTGMSPQGKRIVLTNQVENVDRAVSGVAPADPNFGATINPGGGFTPKQMAESAATNARYVGEMKDRLSTFGDPAARRLKQARGVMAAQAEAEGANQNGVVKNPDGTVAAVVARGKVTPMPRGVAPGVVYDDQGNPVGLSGGARPLPNTAPKPMSQKEVMDARGKLQKSVADSLPTVDAYDRAGDYLTNRRNLDTFEAEQKGQKVEPNPEADAIVKQIMEPNEWLRLDDRRRQDLIAKLQELPSVLPVETTPQEGTPSYSTKESVKAAYAEGKLSLEQAKEIARKNGWK